MSAKEDCSHSGHRTWLWRAGGSILCVTTPTLSWDVVPVDKPDDVNVVIGQAHFIKTVEDLHEALVGVSSSLRFGLGFCEASGPRLVRRSGNDPDLVELATRTALAIAAGHCFVIFLRDGFPVNVLNPVKAVPEVIPLPLYGEIPVMGFWTPRAATTWWVMLVVKVAPLPV